MVERKKNNQNKPFDIDEINTKYGKLPPQAVEVEEAVIGALMLERDAYQIISGIVDTQSFYKLEHQKIFDVIKAISESDKPIDLLSVTIELKNRNILEEVGGPAEITRLTRRVASAAHIEFHARTIAQKFIQRELIRVSTEIQTASYDDTMDVNDLLSEARSKLNEVENYSLSANSGKTMDTVAKEAVKEIEADVQILKEGKTPGISTGLSDLDNSTGGWRNTNLVTIAARPGVGKTSFALFETITAARQTKWGNFYGLEMKSTDLFRIILSGETDIDRSDIRDGRIDEPDWAKINIAIGELEKLPVLWYDDADININQIVSNTRRNKKTGKCDFVIIDYLQLINPSDKKAIREQQIAEITRKLKQMALRENIPVIALSQLNRDIDKRTDKEPNLSDLRESGAIEQDSDVVIFIYESDGEVKLKISKNRRGKKGHPDFWANGQKTKFADHEPIDMNEINPGAGLKPQINFSEKTNDTPF